MRRKRTVCPPTTVSGAGTHSHAQLWGHSETRAQVSVFMLLEIGAALAIRSG